MFPHPKFPEPLFNGYAVELLGLALLELFPTAQLIHSHVTDEGFALEVSFPQEVHPELLVLLEEQMRRLMKEGVLFSQVEMMRENAAAFFETHDQPFLAERALDVPFQTIELLKRGPFLDFSPLRIDVFPKEPMQLAIKLLKTEGEGRDLTLSGVAFQTNDELKEYLKQLKRKSGKKVKTAIEREWLSPEGYLLPLGIKEMEKWEGIWREWVESRRFVRVRTDNLGEAADVAHVTLARQFKSGVAEWASGEEWTDLLTRVCPLSEVLSICTSSLQFIHETVKILDLGVEWIAEFQPSPYVRLKEWERGVDGIRQAAQALRLPYEESLLPLERDLPTLAGWVRDAEGKRWRLGFLQVGVLKETQEAKVQLSLFGPLKVFLALEAGRELQTSGEREKA